MRSIAFTVLSVFLLASPGWSDTAVDAGLFSRGRTRLALSGGYGSFNDRDYAVVGLGAGYYVWDGLEAGVDGEAWLGSRPHLYTLSPEVTYTFIKITSFHPYIGDFYKRTFSKL